jgi:hypothetical protein
MKNFWEKWEFGAWRNDPKLRRCSATTRGVWIDALCVLMELDVPSITDSVEGISRMTGNTQGEVDLAVKELETTNACNVVRAPNGDITLTSRKRERDLNHRQHNKLRQTKFRYNKDVTEESLSGSNSNSCSDSEFWKKIAELYPNLDIAAEKRKMQAWLLTPRGRGRKITRRFVVNWLNKCDAPVLQGSAPVRRQRWQIEDDIESVKRQRAGLIGVSSMETLRAEHSPKLPAIDKLTKRLSELKEELLNA